MADPSAVQNLCDALKAFALPLATTHSGYAFAKDFQTFFAAVIAGCTAAGAAFIAFRAANLTYRGVIDQIKERADVAARERDRRKLGAYLRLRSELRTLEEFASDKAKDLRNELDVLEAKVPIPEVGEEPTDVFRYLDAEEQRTVTWKPLEFPKLDELNIAWNNLDLYPDMAIQPIDQLRRKLQWVEAFPDKEWVRVVVKDGKIRDITADRYRIGIADLASMSKGLIEILEIEIPPLRKALN